MLPENTSGLKFRLQVVGQKISVSSKHSVAVQTAVNGKPAIRVPEARQVEPTELSAGLSRAINAAVGMGGLADRTAFVPPCSWR